MGTPRIEILAAPAPQFEVRIEWKGAALAAVHAKQVAAIGGGFTAAYTPAEIEDVPDPQKMLTGVRKTESSFGATVSGTVGHHTVFAKVRQGHSAPGDLRRPRRSRGRKREREAHRHKLPALPDAWLEGSVRGLRVRGGFEVTLAWNAGKLTSGAMSSRTGGECVVRYGGRTATIRVQRDQTYHLEDLLL